MPRVAGWRRVGGIEARALVEARVLLHQAAQLVTAPGRSLLPPRPDDGQTAFEWLARPEGLAGEWLPAGNGRVRVALELETAALLLLDESLNPVGTRALPGDTLDAAFGWLGKMLEGLGVDVSGLSRAVPYEVPSHPVAAGAAFPTAPLPGFGELARYFADAHETLRSLLAVAKASPLRCWPHHFDLGALLTSGKGESAATVGVGLSPGDGAYPEPYLYVTVWPVPAATDSLPSLPGGGHWHREGWFGAVLTATRLTETDDASEQEARAHAFLETALGAARELAGLDRPGPS